MIEPERLAYDLTPDSLVWDVGAYRGEFAIEIALRYGCHVQAFEAVVGYGGGITDTLQTRPRAKELIEVLAFGLSDRDEELLLEAAGDRTTAFPEAASREIGYRASGTVSGCFRDVLGFLDERQLKQVDLAKVNIEGGEYVLLRRLLDSGRIGIFRHLQVQFHTFMPTFGELYKEIAHGLKETHELSWRWPWRWESWERKAA